MLYTLRDLDDELVKYLADDPVRPSIPHAQRIGNGKDVFVLRDDDNVKAITCVSYEPDVPKQESELFTSAEAQVAIFYTIWSYVPGAGRKLIMDAVTHIRQNKSTIKRFVTLSPKTEMARRFHLKNGAIVFRENPETVNYEYKL